MLILSFILTILSIHLILAKKAGASQLAHKNPAIILASHGSTDPSDLKGILYLENKVKEAFPCYDVHLAFMSNEVREIWRTRNNDSNFKRYFPTVPETFYSIKSVLTTLGLIQETGARLILVQSLHLIDGPEYHDLVSLVENLRKIKTFDRNYIPFPWIGLGAPALGLGDGQKENLQRVSNSLEFIFAEARELGAGVLFIADLTAGINPGVYHNLKHILRNNYQDVDIHIGLPEARIGFKEVLAHMETSLPVPGPLLICPLSLIMVDDVRIDITGPQPDSWVNLVKEKGYTTIPRLKSLGDSPIFAEIFVESLKRLEEAVSRRYTD
jgi:cobalamin biosynthesis Co2+ chelatase CbiK